MAMNMDQLCDDLLAETADLEALVVPLDDAGWETATPAEGWSIKDQVAHLAYFDDRAHESLTDPETFRVERDETLAGGGAMVDKITEANRHLSGDETLAWFRMARARTV